MAPENKEKPSSIRLYKEPEPEPEALDTTEIIATADPGTLEIWPLIDELVLSGEWPEPKLLRQILATGEAAAQPLIEILSDDSLKDWPDEAPLRNVIGLLRMLRPPAAIPALIDVVKRYRNETCEEAVDALTDFGDPGFDALLELCRDPSLGGYERGTVSVTAAAAAGDDPIRKSRLAEILRSLLEDRMAKAREELRLNGKLEMIPREDLDDEDLDELDEDDELEDDSDADDLLDEENYDEDEDEDEDENSEEDEDVIEPFLAEEIGFLIDDLANVKDPLALDLIGAAFEEGLVDHSVVDREMVDASYQVIDESMDEDSNFDWLANYEEDYQAHLKELEIVAAPPPPPRTPRSDQSLKFAEPQWIDEPEPLDLPPTAPIRNTGPKLGRNDPCWCGSGKKYKKCHLGQNEPT